MSIIKPFVERRFFMFDSSFLRKETAQKICKFLKSNPNDVDIDTFNDFYAALERLLTDPSSERILLYIPFYALECAPSAFRETYMETWRRLLKARDVRANFFDGDCFEVDARPNGESERVTKCLHLLPWLFEMGYVSKEYLDELIFISDWYDDFKLNLYEAVSVMVARGSIDKRDPKIDSLLFSCPPRKKVKPLYVSKKREKWLKERENKTARLLTPNIDLSNPFSESFELLLPKLKEIEKTLDFTEIILVGGSQLKGYGTFDSDLDVWEFCKLNADELLHAGSPHSAHIFLNSIWIGSEDSFNDLETLAWRVSNSCKCNKVTRQLSIERLESDLLQYRLLHKGFSRFTGKPKFQTSQYPGIDGDCPFYDDEYRKIATMLYAKYVWI